MLNANAIVESLRMQNMYLLMRHEALDRERKYLRRKMRRLVAKRSLQLCWNPSLVPSH